MRLNSLTIVFVCIILLFVISGGVIYFKNASSLSNKNVIVPTLAPTAKVDNLPKEQTLSGKVICLPHKDKNGPQTLECAIGLQGDDGKNYALDAGGTNPAPYRTGEQVTLKGTVTPIEALSSDHWQKYDIVGIFSIKQ